METLGKARLSAATWLILALVLWNGCGGATASRQQNIQKEVGTENLLQQAGFRKWQVNQNMHQQEALLSALPKRTIVTYERDEQKMHAYGDKDTRTLYIGDDLAYQRYLALAQGRNLCEKRAGGGESVKFWSCMDEYRQGGGGQPGK